MLQKEKLDDEELMEFIILPLSYRKKEEKQRKIEDTVKLATQIENRNQQLFTLAGILAFTDKVIDKETANKIRRTIEMTQVAQIFEEEKQQALTQITQKYEKEKQQAAQIFEEEKKQELKNNSKQIVIRMIKKGYPPEEIVSLVSNYSQDDVEKLRQEFVEDDL